MGKIPEDCPVKEILKQLAAVLALHKEILDHCERCEKGDSPSP